MKFSINKSELQNAVSIVMKGLGTPSSLPVLSGILLDAKGDSVVLQTTDLNLSIQYKVTALIEEEGKTVVPGKLFFDIVKSMPEAAIHVATVESEAHISCDNTSFSVKTLNYEDFPGFPTVETSQSITIPVSQFQSMVKKVSKVVSKDESRAILTGVLVAAEGNTLRMVGTDSYRLALSETVLENEVQDDFQAVISGNFLNDVAGIQAVESEITLALSENQIVITCGGIVFINRRIQGNYPNYKQLLPESYKTKAVVDLNTLTSCVKRASLLSTSTSPLKFDLNIASNTMQITVNSADVGSVQETVVGEIEGEDVEIAFNSTYVLDGLSVIKSEKVSFETETAMKPGIFRAEEPENFLYLIMPVRI